jgi:hypothetical protein
MLTLERKIEKKVEKYKAGTINIEKSVKDWQEKIAIKEIATLSDKCYDSFNDLQMNIAEIEDNKLRIKYEKKSYKETCNFLVYIENKVDEDVYCLLVNKVKSFSGLINHFSTYCSKYEAKYDIELNSEKKLRA